jgi:hypothetical protein
MVWGIKSGEEWVKLCSEAVKKSVQEAKKAKKSVSMPLVAMLQLKILLTMTTMVKNLARVPLR